MKNDLHITYCQMLFSELEYYRISMGKLMSCTLGSSVYNEAWSPVKLEKRLTDCLGKGVIHVAMCNDVLVGAAFGQPASCAMANGLPLGLESDKVFTTFYGAGLFVSPLYSKRGIGTQLVKLRLAFFLNQGFSDFVSVTNTVGEHLTFYRKLGYWFGNEFNTEALRNRKVVIGGRIEDLLTSKRSEKGWRYALGCEVESRGAGQAMEADHGA